MLSMIHYVVYWYTVKRERDARQTVCVCVCLRSASVNNRMNDTCDGGRVRGRGVFASLLFSQPTFCAPGTSMYCARETGARV